MEFLKLGKLSLQAKAAFFFTIAVFICKGINFITLPIFTRLLTTEEMGIVTTYNSWQVLLVVFANLSLDSGSFNIAMMEYRNERYKYMSSILFLSTVSSICVGILYFVIKPFVLRVVGLNESLMLLMLLSFIFLPATTFWMLHQRYCYKYKSTAVVTLLSTGSSLIISAICTYYASKIGKTNLADIRLISGNVILIIWGAIFYFLIFKRGKTAYNKKYWKFVLLVNTPLLFHGLAKHILDVSDRTMISFMVGKSEVGVYGVLYSVSSLALIVWSAINASLIPYMFEHLRIGQNQKVSNFVIFMMLVYSASCICLTLVAPELVKILATEEYMEAVFLMPPIAAGIFFTALYNVYSNLLLYLKKTNYIMVATVVAALFNVACNYIFIQLFGYQAAAYTTLASFMVLAFMQFSFLKKTCDKTNIIHDKTIWLIAIVTSVICIAVNVLYKMIILRYMMIGVFFILIVLNYKKIIFLYKRMKCDE